jgi:hypothetical protein
MSGRNIRAQRRQAEEAKYIGFGMAPSEDDDDEPDEWQDVDQDPPDFPPVAPQAGPSA